MKYDTVKLGWSTIFNEGSQNTISKNYSISLSEDQF